MRRRVARRLLALLVVAAGVALASLWPRPGPDQRPFTEGFTAPVVGVSDGDTIRVLRGTEVKVRLAEIDCPERRQPFGTRAQQRTSELAFGQVVRVVETGAPDRWGRLVAEVLLPDGRSLNRELVREGLAWHYERYSDSPELGALEAAARRTRVGLWVEPGAIPPWEWRRQRARQVTPKGGPPASR
jgi:endonuclease YncB( thermonuclease family)